MEKSDKKQYLKKHFPALFNLLEDEAFHWRGIDKTHQKAEQKRQTEQANSVAAKRAFHPDAHFFDIVERALHGDDQARNFLGFFSTLFQQLSRLMDAQQKKHLKSTIYSFLTSTDGSYLNFTGELLVLYKLLHSGDYQFNEKAFPLGNGNDADFSMKHVPAGRRALIEVVNIHVEADAVSSDPEDIGKFLSHRLSQKIEKKQRGAEYVPSFILVPVIWGPVAALRRISDFYKTNTIAVPSASEAVAYCTFYDQNNTAEYHFGTISTLFDREKA